MSEGRVFDVMKDLSLQDWPSLLVGWNRGWAARGDIISFAVQWLMDNPDETDDRVALMAGGESYEDDDLLKMLVEHVGSPMPEPVKDSAIDKWRLAHLMALSRSALDPDAKLDRLEELYADFGYPRDMAACSQYYSTPSEQQVGLSVGDQASSPLDAMQEVIDRLQLRFDAS